MKGFREAPLTEVLCIVEPQRFIPIVKYTGLAGKKEIAEAFYGLRSPGPRRGRVDHGRLIFWSNDLLRKLAGAGFTKPPRPDDRSRSDVPHGQADGYGTGTLRFSYDGSEVSGGVCPAKTIPCPAA